MTTVILDPHWRTMDELFSPASQRALEAYSVVWGRDETIPPEVLQDALPDAEFLIAATPVVTAQTLEAAPHLRAVVEVSGSFPDTIDYAACAARGVEVLSCAPGFRAAVAEMGLAMTLAAARGLVREHEAFRTGEEQWLDDCAETDFTLFGADVGFVGFGQIAQEMMRLLAPFEPSAAAYDPWLPVDVAEAYGIELMGLEALAARSKVLYVTAVPTAENAGLVSREVLAKLGDKSLVVVLSRAHLVDFDALKDEAAFGRLQVATDVFPQEPVPSDDSVRSGNNMLLSPHRAAAVPGGRHLIGDMVLSDIAAILEGRPDRMLTRADPERIASLAGIGDASQVADMAVERSS